MNGSRNCGNCKFWNRIAGGQGQCQRHTPQGHLIFAPNKLTSNMEPSALSYWPPTQQSQWCGEHEADFEAIGD